MLNAEFISTGEPTAAEPGAPAFRGVRRITDARGMVWRVRDVWADGGHALLFSCSVAGFRAELHASDVLLATLSDEELLDMLSTTDD